MSEKNRRNYTISDDGGGGLDSKVQCVCGLSANLQAFLVTIGMLRLRRRDRFAFLSATLSMTEQDHTNVTILGVTRLVASGYNQLDVDGVRCC